MDLQLGPWLTVTTAYLDRTPGGPLTLVYEVTSGRGGQPLSDLTRARDRRGRSVFEAFTAVRARYHGDRTTLRAFLDAAAPELVDIRGGLPFLEDGQRDALSAALTELLDFVHVFGPIGVAWPGTLEVSGIASLLDRSDSRATLERFFAAQITPGEVDQERIERALAVSEPSWVGRVGSSTGRPYVNVSRGPSADQRYIWPSTDPFRSDSIEAIADAQERALEAASVVERLVRLGPVDQSRSALVGHVLDLASEAGGEYARIRLVDSPNGVGLERQGESLLAYIYEDLLTHVERKPRLARGLPGPHFPVPTCEVCGGSVLARRRPGARLDKTHAGCRDTAKSRRRAQRQRGTRGSTEEDRP